MPVNTSHAQNHGRPPPLADMLHTFEANLIEQRRFRVEQLAELSHVLQPGAAVTDDPQRQVAAQLAEAARRALADIDAALLRLRHGSYGRCVACQQPIPVERLEVLPQSAHCVICQQHQEHRFR